eukprot:GHVR01091748.1.p1 GENE.GHVR01091748.1~~GHVR01091748.1.p1  ORF type:complete len:1004 (-),score=265.98 GHVR01091748.1:304-3315(-)
MFREYVHAITHTHTQKSFPDWVLPDKIRDLNGRRPFDDDYDPSTLRIPTSEHEAKRLSCGDSCGHFTPAIAKYWEVKSTNFDKVVLFKVGKFYEMFYVDAYVVQRLCDLKWMADEKPHVGFPEQSLHYHARKMVTGGFKVVVVEQTETPQELLERNKQGGGKKDKTVSREVCEVLTPGTLVHESMLPSHSRSLLVLFFEDTAMGDEVLMHTQTQAITDVEGVEDTHTDTKTQEEDMPGYGFGLCIADISTGQLSIGRVGDNSSRGCLTAVVAQVRPAEVVYSIKNTPHTVLKLLKNIPAGPQLSHVGGQISSANADSELEYYFGDTPPPLLSRLCQSHEATAAAFALCCEFLRGVLLDERMIKLAVVSEYAPFDPTYMILDAPALANLEILCGQDGKESSSLLSYIDHTRTPSGRRMLRQWVASPLCLSSHIEARLEAVQWLLDNPDETSMIRDALGKLPVKDMERSLAQLLRQSLQSARKAIYFQDIHQQQLTALVKFCDAMNSLCRCVCIYNESNIMSIKDTLPILLFSIRVGEIDGGSFPDVFSICDNVKNKIKQTVDDYTGKTFFIPKGGDPDVDDANGAVESVVCELGGVLETLKKRSRLKDLAYVHKKFRYEVQVAGETLPSSLKGEPGVDITSSVKGYIRVHTDEIKELLIELEKAEQKQKDAHYPFIQRLTHTIRNNHTMFTQAMKNAATLDCLCSLAIASQSQGGITCRPVLVTPSESTPPILVLEDSRHPVVASVISSSSTFIPNDVFLNNGEGESGVMILTGPNMGGKSTLLRQTCVCVILAQIGCFVPASKCILTPVDRIYTRLGASDSLLEGKSTFLVELEDTAALLNTGTRYSLAVIDELGRGTSTFDGTAIALATLEYITYNVMCRTLFATHFHLLCNLFEEKDAKNFHMSLTTDIDGQVTFLFKLMRGVCPSSHGVHVARLAGLPDELLKVAAVKSNELQKVATDIRDHSRCISFVNEVCASIEGGGEAALHDLYSKVHMFSANGAI